MKNLFFILFITGFFSSLLQGQMTSQELLHNSIEFHDPSGNWNEFEGELSFKVLWPDKPDGKRKIHIDNGNQSFAFWAEYDEGQLHYKVVHNAGEAYWNKDSKIPEEFKEKYKISTDRAIMYRDYYTYLYGMPMKLKDPGTIIDPKVEEVEFYGKTYNRIRVTYEPTVGEDIWYFYFDQTSNALEAYQFFHDESKNDGEYILFEELKEIDKVKIPKVRKWFYNVDEKFLATDLLE